MYQEAIELYRTSFPLHEQRVLEFLGKKGKKALLEIDPPVADAYQKAAPYADGPYLCSGFLLRWVWESAYPQLPNRSVRGCGNQQCPIGGTGRFSLAGCDPAMQSVRTDEPDMV